MDIIGHFSNHFTIDQQVFGEKFKVILKSSIYLIDKNGNISRQTEKKIISDWICADENIVPELGNGLDIADIIVDEIHENDNGCSDVAKKKTEVCTAPMQRDTHEYTTSGEATRNIGDFDGIELSRGLKLKLNLESFKIKACSTLEKTLSTVTKEMNMYNIALDASSQIVDLDTNSIDKDSQEVSEATYCVEDQSDGRCISDKSSYIYGTIEVADLNTENENLANDNDEVPTLLTSLNNKTNINAELREELIANTYNAANVNSEMYSKTVENGTSIHYDSLELNDGIGSSEPIEVFLWDPLRMPSSLERKHQIVEAFKSHDSKKARHESSPDYPHFDVEIYTSYSTDTNGQDNHENDHNSTQGKETLDKRTTNQIEKMKRALINQGLASKIPAGEMSSTLLLAKLRLEVEAAKRVTVVLADHKDKFEKVKFISMEQRHRSTRIKDKSYISYMCKVCDSFQVGEEEKMRLHLEQHLNGDFKCKFCGLDCKHPRERKQHYKEHHPNERLRPPAPIRICEKCGAKTASSVTWKNHTYKCLGIPSFSCQICSEKFPSNKILKGHIRNDHTDCTYFCEKCDQQFTDETHWAVHTVRCEGGIAVKGSYSCHLCKRLLSSLTQLKRHIRRNHDREKQYQCQLCSYSSFRPQRMKHHMAVHEGR